MGCWSDVLRYIALHASIRVWEGREMEMEMEMEALEL
jgi:hypothetical protein